jgi:hypothetical protein
VILQSKTLPSFWECYFDLPQRIQERAQKQFELFARNSHPSLHLKPVGDFWSVRVTEGFRALAFRDRDVFTWFWIGPHGEYERLLKG